MSTDASGSGPRPGAQAGTGLVQSKSGAPGVQQQTGPPDMAVQIMRRLEVLERENQRMRDQLALQESQRGVIPGDATSVPPPPAPYWAPNVVREQSTVDTRVLRKPVNRSKG